MQRKTGWLYWLMAFVFVVGQMGGSALSARAAMPATETTAGLANTGRPVGTAPQSNPPRPLYAPTASVSLGVPPAVFLGEDFNFTVTFDNAGDAPGYGPFVDLIFPVTGQDGDDGIDFLSATYLGTALETVEQTFPNDGGGTGCVDHPWLRDNTGAYVQVCGTAGDKLVSIRLPFGSFVPDQPPLDIAVKAHLSNLADISPALVIKARGGYMYGATPLDDWCCGDTPIAQPDTTDGTGWPSASVTPVIMTMTKAYNGPSNTSAETATGPNYPRSYTIAVDVATGQTVNNMRIVDTLPNDVQFLNYTVSGATVNTENSTPLTTTPDGTLDLTLNAVTGAAGDDVTVTINYYVPRLDAGSAAVIDPATGAAVASTNSATVSGDWTPVDPRDTPTSITADGSPGTATVMHRSLAIQKSVAVVGGGDPAPGKTLEYTLAIQVSDFFAFDNVVVTDVISDGQHVDSTFTPTLQVNGNSFSLATTAFSSGNYDIACDYSGTAGAECTTDNTATPNTGQTTLTFNLSDELVTQSLDSRLVGGCVDPVNGSPTPDCGTYNDGPTTATITFRTVIQEAFTDDYPSNDASVDQGDTLNDTTTVAADLLNTGTFVTGPQVTDDAAASITIGRGSLTKSIYAINDSTSLPTDGSGNVVIKPGDKVTYRLTYTLTTSDVEELSFDDYLPLPVFDVADPDADGTAGPTWAFSSAGGIPAPGVVTLGPSDTFYQYMTDGIANGTGVLSSSANNSGTQDPVVGSDSAANKIVIYYANYDDTRNQSTTVDLLFSVEVSAEPFADGLFLTNQAHAYEGSTNAASSTADSIVQVKLTEPVLVGSKGVVWTSNPNATLSAAAGPVTFLDPTNAPRWSGTINSAGLAANPIDANVSGVDAGDIVTFAITIENQGASLNGAFDITLRDVLDTAYYQIPSGGLNLQVYYGDGSGPISWNGLGGGPDGTNGTADDLFGGGIELVDPVGQGVCQAHDPNLGNNVILITYDLQVRPDVTPGESLNTMHLMSYAGTEGGPNHLAQDLTDGAASQTVADFTKTLEGTEVVTASNGATDVVIGELVTYKLTATIPEGTIPNARLDDQLDGGLAYVSCTSVTAYSGGAPTTDVTTDLASGSDFSGVCTNDVTVTNSGTTISFNLGNITNNNTDNTQAETIEVVYQAVVLNVSSNQGGTLLNNAAEFFMNDGTNDISLGTGAAANVTILEPQVDTTKSVSPATADAGDTVTFTIILKNNGNADAYDVAWQDVVPSGLTYSSGTLSASCTTYAITVSDVSAPTLKASVTEIDVGETCTITFDATVAYSVTPGQLIPNKADTTWTSLPGGTTNDGTTDERTGADGVGGALNDYASSATADVTVSSVAPNKYLMTTSEDHTSGSDVAVGEIVRYRLVVAVPEGTSNNFQLQDQLPPGLIFLNDGTAKLGFVTNGSGITATGFDTVPSLFGCTVSGNAADATTPASSALPCTLSGGSIADTSVTTADTDNYSSGTDVYFRLGNLVNNDNDADAEYVVLEFNALVANDSNTNAGATLSNQFAVFIGGTQNGSNSNSIDVTVVEPHITVDKNLVTAAADAGDPMVYRISITNDASGAGAAAAFDLSLTDTLNTYLNLGLVTIYTDGTNGSTTLAGTCGSTTQTVTDSSGSGAGATVQIDISCLNPGEKVVVDIAATVVANAPAGLQIPNTASGSGSSLPGTGTASNPTGSTTPGVSGAANGERDGSDGVGGTLNDYASSASASTVTLATPTIVKSATPANATIGDLVTFDLLVTLPEGLTQSLEVFDNLPVGLDYVSHQVITTAAASGGRLSADFNGTLPSPTVNVINGSGGDLTLTFGNTTVTDDNDTTNNAFLVQITARVLNESGNQDGANLDNTGTVRWTNPNTNNTDSASSTATVGIIEPRIETTKSVSPTSGVQAGDTLTYTVRFTNTGNSTAYDVTADDTLPGGVTYDSGSASCQDGNSNAVAVSVTASGQTLHFDGNPSGSWDIPAGGSITCTYTATADSNITLGGSFTNTADADWSSLDGSASGERVYDDTAGTPQDGTQDEASATFTTAQPSTLTKDDGGVTQSMIGDTIHVTITIDSPTGQLANTVVTDVLPAGMKYVTGSQSVSGISAATFTVTGPNDGTAPTTLEWDFGNATISSSPFTISYNAVATNTSGNVDGTNLVNDVTFSYDDAVGTTHTLTGSDDTTIVEAALTVNKQISSIDATPDAGDTVTYQVTIANPSTGSNASGYDVHFEDVLPAQVALVAGSVNVTIAGGATGVTDNSDVATNTVDVTIDDVPLDATVTIKYQATIQSSVTPAELIANTGKLTWTSQPGTNPDERTGADGVGGALNDYAAESTATFSISDPYYSKSLVGGSEPSSVDPNFVIGEIVTFAIDITLPEGTTPNLTVVDALPAGLQYITGSAALDATNFNGSVPVPTISTPNTPPGSGDDVTFTFGTITVTADNDDTNNTFRITFEALILNEAGNQQPGPLDNQATATIDLGGGNTLALSSTDDNESINIVEPDLALTKSVDDTAPGYGQTITYTLSVAHTGNSTADAFDVVVTDTIPAGLTYVSGSIGAPTGWVADDSAAPTLTWTCSGGCSLPLGNTANLTYDVTVDGPPAPPAIGDTLTNSAALTWTSLPGTDANERTGDDGPGGALNDYADTASQTVTVTNINLTLTKDDGGIPAVNAGDTIAYTLTYANSGNKDATGVVITETVPANTTFNAGSSTAGWSCNDGDPAGTTCTYTVGALAANASGTVTFAVTVDNPLPDAVTEISNSASIADDGTNGVEDTNDNTASATTPVDAVPDLTLTKDDGFNVVSAGSLLVYTLDYANVGTQEAVNVVITDTVPDNTTFDAANSSAGWTCDDANNDGVNGTPGDLCTYAVGNLAGGNTTGSVDIAFRVDDPLDATVTQIVNTAEIADDGTNGTDPTPADNSATDTDTVNTANNGRTSKTFVGSNQTFTTDPQVAIGEILTYEVTLVVPPGSMANVTLTDTLGRGLAFLRCESVNLGGVTSTAGDAAALCNDPTNPTVSRHPAASTDAADDGRQIVWNFGTLTNAGAADATLTVRYQVVVLDIADNVDGVSGLNNQAVWAWDGGSDSDTAASVNIVEPDLTITKSVNRHNALPGQTLTFTLLIEHTAASNIDAWDVVVTDVLPPQLEYVPGSVTVVNGPPWDALTEPTAIDPTLEIIWNHLATTDQIELTFQVRLGNLEPGDTVVNAANVAWTSLPGDVSAPQSTYNQYSTERWYDPASPVDIYREEDTAYITVPALPATGFAPGRVTTLPAQPEGMEYANLGDMRLEIPALGVDVPVIGVPLDEQGWDLTWLSDQAGWLEGTAYPTWNGNTALTGHVYLADGTPGPFVNLGSLYWGQRIILHAYGQRYIYEVRAVRQVMPGNLDVLSHKTADWLTLITCKDYNERTDAYTYRVAVQAVLVDVQPDE